VPSDNHLDDQSHWTVDHVETVPMNTQQYADSVAALAALIAQWETNQQTE
jgi:hypothetical protein